MRHPSPFNLSSDIPREKVTDHCKMDGGTTVLTESLLLSHGGAESLARGHGIVSVIRK